MDTSAAPFARVPPRRRRRPSRALIAAFGVALVATAALLLAPPSAVVVALGGAAVLCALARAAVQRASIVVGALLVLLVAGAFDRRGFALVRAPAPTGGAVAWLVDADGARVLVGELPLRAVLGVTRGSVARIDDEVAGARVVWARDGRSFVVAGRPPNPHLWRHGKLAWDDEHVLGRVTLPATWDEVPTWSGDPPTWLAELDAGAFVEPMVLAWKSERRGPQPAASAAPSREQPKCLRVRSSTPGECDR